MAPSPRGLELTAGFLALGHFLLLLKNCYVLIRRDSITTVVYTDCLRHLLCDITQPGSHSDCVEQ